MSGRAEPVRLILLVGCLVVAASSAGGCNALRRDFGEFIGRSVDLATGNTASNNATRMEDPYFPDERRDGINRLARRDFGKAEPYTTRYQQIAQTDENFIVRATAIRALNRSRDASAGPIFVAGLDAQETLVRLEAAKALANVPDETAVPKLLRMVGDQNEDKDVRVAAADALRHHRKIEVGRALVNVLSARDFAIAWQARQSLRRLTAADYGYDEAAWLALLSGPNNPFS